MGNKVICQYRVAAGNEADFEDLLRRHWPTLHKLGLVTDERPLHFKGSEQDNGRPIYFEIFDWREDAGRASEHPEVMAIWEPMDQLCEERGGKPNMEFPHVSPLHV